jgi:hypothetical protein
MKCCKPSVQNQGTEAYASLTKDQHDTKINMIPRSQIFFKTEHQYYPKLDFVKKKLDHDASLAAGWLVLLCSSHKQICISVAEVELTFGQALNHISE